MQTSGNKTKSNFEGRPGFGGKIDPKKIQIQKWVKEGESTWVKLYKGGELNPHNYSQCTITHVNNSTKKVKLSYEDGYEGPEEVYPMDLIQRAEILHVGDDLFDLDFVNEAEILRTLQVRYQKNISKTFLGQTLISLNPYMNTEEDEDPEVEQDLIHYALEGGEAPAYPQVKYLAARAFRQLLDKGKNQTIFISGQTGSGKSHALNQSSNFLTSLSQEANPDEVSVEEKIKSSFRILEAFGNAKTAKNYNSSRFGKYFKIYFDRETKQVKGAKIDTYILEESRVIQESNLEIIQKCSTGWSKRSTLLSLMKTPTSSARSVSLISPDSRTWRSTL